MRVPKRHELLRSVQRPSVDLFGDPTASFVGDSFQSPDGFAGNCVLLQPCDCGCDSDALCLVEVSEAEYATNPEGYAVMSRLAGEVVWGDVSWTRVDVDRTAVYEERGFDPLTTFESYLWGAPGTEYQVLVRRAEYHALEANGYRIVAQTGLDATDLLTDASVTWKRNTREGPRCERIVTPRCRGWFCQEFCEIELVEEDDGTVLKDCRCPQGWLENPFGGCWWTNYYRCETVDCPPGQKCVSRYMGCECA